MRDTEEIEKLHMNQNRDSKLQQKSYLSKSTFREIVFRENSFNYAHWNGREFSFGGESLANAMRIGKNFIRNLSVELM